MITFASVFLVSPGLDAADGFPNFTAHTFIMQGQGMLSPTTFLITVIPLYLLWMERKKFAGLVR